MAPARPDDTNAARSGSSRGIWILIIILLTPAIILPLASPLYDRAKPTLFGFPFFFWFQFALILMAAVVTSVAYGLSRVADRRDRDARAQLPTAGNHGGEQA